MAFTSMFTFCVFTGGFIFIPVYHIDSVDRRDIRVVSCVVNTRGRTPGSTLGYIYTQINQIHVHTLAL